jgi:hypothetical protein
LEIGSPASLSPGKLCSRPNPSSVNWKKRSLPKSVRGLAQTPNNILDACLLLYSLLVERIAESEKFDLKWYGRKCKWVFFVV